MSRNSLRWFVWLVVLVSLIWAVVMGLNLVPVLRGGAGWRWPYVSPSDHLTRFVPVVVALGLYLVGGWWFFKQRGALGIVAWAVIGSLVLPLSALHVETDRPRYELYTRTVSNLTTGWHYSAAEMDDLGGAEAVLHGWLDFTLECVGVCSHVAASPPGMSLVYYVTNQMLERVPAAAAWLARPLRADQCHNYHLMSYSDAELASAWLGILTPLWASLTVLPLYWLGCKLHDQKAARWAVILWPLVPSFLMFTPHPSTVYPLLAALIVALLVEGLAHRQPLWVLASGVMTSVSTFVSFAFLPLVFLAALLTLLVTCCSGSDRPDRRLRRLTVVGLFFGAGLAVVWVIFYAVSGLTPWALITSDAMREGHLIQTRPYLLWLFLHLNDFFMFTGWPIILVAGIAIWRAGRALVNKEPLSMGGSLSLATSVTLIAVDLSGFVRGETGRVWLFFAPFFVLMAAGVLSNDEARRSRWALIGTQAIIVLTMVMFMHVIDSGLSDPPVAPPPLAESPQTSYIPNGTVFGDALRLSAFTGQVAMLPNVDGSPQPTLVLWLDWQSRGRVTRPYYLSFIPVGPDAQPTQATLEQPFGGSYPTTCWSPEDGLLQDRFLVPLFGSAPGGDWWVSLSLIDGDTGEQLGVILPDGSHDDQVGLGPFPQASE